MPKITIEHQSYGPWRVSIVDQHGHEQAAVMLEARPKVEVRELEVDVAEALLDAEKALMRAGRSLGMHKVAKARLEVEELRLKWEENR